MKNKASLSRYFLGIIIILSIMGFIISSYLLYLHSLPLEEHTTGFCDITRLGGCSKVNNSIYSKVFGVPVAAFGMFWFIIIFLLAHSIKKDKRILNRSPLHMAYYWSVLGFSSVIYFVWAEYQLKSICFYCTTVHIIVVAIFALLTIKRNNG